MTSGLDDAARLLGVDPTPTLARTDAVDRIRAASARRDIARAAIAISERPVRPGQLFDAAGERVPFPFPDDRRYQRCFVALVDPAPETRWSHPAYWAFLPAGGSGEVELIPTDLPPHDEGPIRFIAIAP